MRILVLSNYANGLFLFRKELIQAFIDSGHEVFISVPPDENCDKLRNLGWNVLETPLDRHSMNPVKDLKLFRAYLGFIKRYKPDVVLTYTIKPNIYGALAARMKKIPYICNVTGLGKAIENGGFVSKVLISLYRLSTRKAKKVFFQNVRNKSICQDRGIAVNNADLLPGSGVNLTLHPFREYPSEADGIRILAVLRVMRDKGIEEYFEAAKEISTERRDVHFELVGEYEEDERQKYEPMIHSLEDQGVLKYYGHIDNVEEVMANSHILVHPSYHEGLSNVLLEAAACGRPVVTSNINGCKEAVVEGKSGFLCKSADAQDLVKEINHMIALSEDERKEMGRIGRKHIEEHFDRNIIISKYEDELSSLT